MVNTFESRLDLKVTILNSQSSVVGNDFYMKCDGEEFRGYIQRPPFLPRSLSISHRQKGECGFNGGRETET